MIEVRSVEAAADHLLYLTFSNGEIRCFDVKPYLGLTVFHRLRNPAFFSLARLDYGTVTWPGDIDIAPETLYHESQPLTGRTEAQVIVEHTG
ncbi:MAG: DUF2442 domain-containing protein [Acidobacteria bacterium]|nr:DUF2442 domain-containing protein [Acidobacteriota bacterium]